MTVISQPTPPYANVPIHPEFYTPKRFEISGIALGQVTTVTTVLPMDYVIGQQVRLIIPPSFGTRQLNDQTGYVIEIPSLNSVVITIVSQFYDTFTLSTETNRPQILAIGDINNGQINAFGRYPVKTYIPGSFRNISPL